MPANPNGSPEELNPPIAKTILTTLEEHGRSRVDQYYWLSERDNPDVPAYLEEENDYARRVMAHQSKFEETLFEEIKGRIKQTDLSVPYKLDDYYYYTRYEEGREYPLYCRKRETLEAREEMMLDVNVLARAMIFCHRRDGRELCPGSARVCVRYAGEAHLHGAIQESGNR